MALTPGTRFGSYEIAEAIGAGGMGEVYRAHDPSLKRDVAIKVLPASLANDADRLARFQREAETLAALNHSNIAHIYGIERASAETGADGKSPGKELYYLNPAGEMMAAPIAAVGDALEPGAPVVLFPTHIVGGGSDTQGGWQYDVAPDGRFLINMELDDASAPITLIQHWNPAAKQ
jgi:serine/threonine protein kinase